LYSLKSVAASVILLSLSALICFASCCCALRQFPFLGRRWRHFEMRVVGKMLQHMVGDLCLGPVEFRLIRCELCSAFL
jgi:hypothetical protein